MGLIVKVRMSRKRKWLAFAAIVAFIAVAALCLPILMIANLFACEIDVKRSTPSPDGERIVVMFARECGATVPFNTQLSLARSGRSFSLDSNPSFLVVDGAHDLSVRWIGEKALAIDLPKGDRVFRSERQIDDVMVEYR